MNNLKSECLMYFPNLNSLMKISLGLILFTILSTALVYAETKPMDENNLTIHIIENAFLYDSAQYFDNTMISTNPGKSLIIINDDTVSHSFVSGVSNSNHQVKINYNMFLLCELGEKILPTGISGYHDDNTCNFNKDNRIITGEISPGESVSIFLDEIGTYRIIDPDYPWMEITAYSFPEFSTTFDTNESKVTSTSTVDKPLENISVDINDTSFNVQYTTTGMIITGIESDTESTSLIFFVNVIDLSGRLNVEFDRTFFDSVYDGVDDSFFILADGDESVFEETETKNQSRTLSITVPYGTEELEIIGSMFGSSIQEIIVEEIIVEEIIVEEIIVEEIIVEEIIVNDVPNNECGPGTILEGDTCVLDSTPVKSQSTGNFRELIMSVSTTLGIAGIIGIILALIARANRNKN